MGVEIKWDYNDVQENYAVITATATFTCTGIPSNAKITGHLWGEDFNGYTSSGSNRASLTSDIRYNKQSSNQLPISCTVTCVFYYSITTTTTNADGSTSSVTENYSTEEYSDTASGTIYFHPGSWSWGANQGDSICNCITAAKDTQWRNHFQDAYRWKEQRDVSYRFTKIPETGDPITAAWYNERAKAMNDKLGKNIDEVKGGEDGTVITAKVINKLNFSGIT